jgi:RimJ/RimL family protein N-acetyltransferase
MLGVCAPQRLGPAACVSSVTQAVRPSAHADAMPLRLRDGRQVWIRPIRPSDKARLLAAHDRLSVASVHARYLSSKPHLSRADLSYLTEVDGRRHLALVAVPVDQPGRLVGVARAVALPDDPCAAEIAFVVDDEWQGVGLASELVELLADQVAEIGIRRAVGIMFAENQGARALFRRLDPMAHAEFLGAGTIEVVADLRSRIRRVRRGSTSPATAPALAA